jgi:hypothetical protein
MTACAGALRFTTVAVRCEERHAALPRMGRLKLHEDARRLADPAATLVAGHEPAAII